MGLDIRHLSELPQAVVIQFLEQQQGAPASHTRWKYYDEDFNAGRLRGFVAMDGSDMVGLLGLIPFHYSLNKETVETSWTCDWFVDAERASGATGIALLKAATAAHDSVYHTGGGEVTKQLFGRLANFTEDDAVQEYRTILRMEYFVNRAKKRKPWINRLPIGLAGNIPLGRLNRESSSVDDLCVPGIADFVGSMVDRAEPTQGFHPMYDRNYLEWFSRNPDIECYSCSVSQHAAAVVWHPLRDYPRQTQSEWRLAFLTDSEAGAELSELTDVAVAFAKSKGANSVKALISREDERLSRALLSAKFSQSRQTPFFAFYKQPESMPQASMSGLSFLDADNATLY